MELESGHFVMVLGLKEWSISSAYAHIILNNYTLILSCFDLEPQIDRNQVSTMTPDVFDSKQITPIV